MEVTINFPPQITQTDPLLVKFLTRVIRVQEKYAARVGIATLIEEYEFVRPGHELQDAAGLQAEWNLSH